MNATALLVLIMDIALMTSMAIRAPVSRDTMECFARVSRLLSLAR